MLPAKSLPYFAITHLLAMAGGAYLHSQYVSGSLAELRELRILRRERRRSTAVVAAGVLAGLYAFVAVRRRIK